jgi:sugar phosphate isomerase/epimerase
MSTAVEMAKTSRRKFLTASSAWAAITSLEHAALGAGLPGARTKRIPSEPHINFPSEPRDRLAVASWPFRALIESPSNRWARDPKQPGIDLKDFGALVVERFNVGNIEPLSDHFRSTDAAYLGEFRRAIEKAGVRVINIPVGGQHSFYDPDPARRRMAVDYGKKWIDVAVALGSESIRIHVAGVRNAKPDVGRAAESLARLAGYGAGKGVVVNLENDDLVSEDAFFLVKVIDQAHHPWLHALPDFCNSMLSGNEQFNYDALSALFKRAYNICHVKDSEVDQGKVFTVELAKAFGILKSSGYRGYCSMEFEGEGSPYDGTQKLIDASLKHLA